MTREPAGPDVAAASLRAVGAAILGAGIWIGFAGPLSVTLGLNITSGLVAVAAFIGWLIGSATRSGAHGAEPRPSAPSVRAIAVGGALFAWLLALVGVYLYSLAALPSLGPAGSSLAERMAATPIVDFYAQQLGPIDAVEVVVLLVAAWWSSR